LIEELARGKILGFPVSWVIVGLLVVGFLYVPAFNTAVTDLWNSITLSSTGLGVGVYTGNVQFIETIQDKILGTVVDPTVDTYTLYYDTPTATSGGLALTAAGHTITAPASGFVWLAINGGSDYYFCEDYFNSLNSKWVVAGSGFWADLANNNSPDYCVKIDTSKAGINGQAQTPNINLVIPELEEDMTLAVGTGAADTNLVGAASVVTAHTWALNGILADDGLFITRLYFTVNTTMAGGQVKFEELTLSGGLLGGGAQTYWAQPVEEIEGSTSYHYYITGKPERMEYPNGERFWYKTGEPSTMYLTLNVRTVLVDGQSITLCIDAVDGAGTAQAQLTDAVVMNHG
jgi:hypothetical protein